MYTLMRPKKNQTPQERLVKLCSGPVFMHLHKYDKNYLERVEVITGNLEETRLGINDAGLDKLKQEVDVVIHAAADVRFNEPLYDLVLTNLCGTRELLELSKEMARLKVFVYLSTAFSNCKFQSNENIEEKFYPPPMDADKLINYVKGSKAADDDRELLKIVSANLIRPWPNNYTFSKALSESIVQRYGNHFPIAVIRPSISKNLYMHCPVILPLLFNELNCLCYSIAVISTFKDPIAAWSNSYGGMNGVTAGIGSGLLRNLFWKNIELNVICADFVTNGSLVAAWHTAEEYNKTIFMPKVYHINRASDKALYFGKLIPACYYIVGSHDYINVLH